MVEHKKTFHLHSGKKFDNLKGLAKELKDMSTESFTHHVNKTKNDFANWAKHSLNNKKLAGRIEKRLDKLEIELEVLRHIVHDNSTSPKKKTTKKTTKKAVTKTAKKNKN